MKSLSEDHAKYNLAQNVLQNCYGIKADSIGEFYSFEDQNFYVKINSKCPHEREFTLKIINPEVSKDAGD